MNYIWIYNLFTFNKYYIPSHKQTSSCRISCPLFVYTQNIQHSTLLKHTHIRNHSGNFECTRISRPVLIIALNQPPTPKQLRIHTGGPSRAQWEDVTGSTPLTFVNDCVSFTTTVSARFWLMDCRNIADATKMATDLYRYDSCMQ